MGYRPLTVITSPPQPYIVLGLTEKLQASLAGANVKRVTSRYSHSMIYRAKLRVKVPGDRVATDKHRNTVLKLVEKHGGRLGTPNPRQHVVGIFADKAAMKAFRAEARVALTA